MFIQLMILIFNWFVFKRVKRRKMNLRKRRKKMKRRKAHRRDIAFVNGNHKPKYTKQLPSVWFRFIFHRILKFELCESRL